MRHTIDADSHVAIGRFLNEKFGDSNGFCVAGLHACADLTVDALDIFLKMAAARAIVLMSCCYHKMAPAADDGSFKNFPLSECLRGVWLRQGGGEFLRVPFLRLAAQPSSVSESLKDIVFNLMSRAVIQLYADKCKWASLSYKVRCFLVASRASERIDDNHLATTAGTNFRSTKTLGEKLAFPNAPRMQLG